jgi:hypothetical protein
VNSSDCASNLQRLQSNADAPTRQAPLSFHELVRDPFGKSMAPRDALRSRFVSNSWLMRVSGDHGVLLYAPHRNPMPYRGAVMRTIPRSQQRRE